MSLWDLLTVFQVSTAVGASIGVAKAAGGGTTKVVLAVVTGVAIGVSGFFGVRVTGDRLCRRIDRVRGADPSWVERRYSLVYLMAGVWMFVTGAVGGVVTHVLIRLWGS